MTAERRATLEAAGRARGLGEGEIARMIALVDLADGVAAPAAPPSPDAESAATPDKEPAPLYMYLLPFVTVGEVRRIWLRLDTPLPNCDETTVASRWAAINSAPAGMPAPESTPDAAPVEEPAPPAAAPPPAGSAPPGAPVVPPAPPA